VPPRGLVPRQAAQHVDLPLGPDQRGDSSGWDPDVRPVDDRWAVSQGLDLLVKVLMVQYHLNTRRETRDTTIAFVSFVYLFRYNTCARRVFPQPP